MLAEPSGHFDMNSFMIISLRIMVRQDTEEDTHQQHSSLGYNLRKPHDICHAHTRLFLFLAYAIRITSPRWCNHSRESLIFLLSSYPFLSGLILYAISYLLLSEGIPVSPYLWLTLSSLSGVSPGYDSAYLTFSRFTSLLPLRQPLAVRRAIQLPYQRGLGFPTLSFSHARASVYINPPGFPWLLSFDLIYTPVWNSRH